MKSIPKTGLLGILALAFAAACGGAPGARSPFGTKKDAKPDADRTPDEELGTETSSGTDTGVGAEDGDPHGGDESGQDPAKEPLVDAKFVSAHWGVGYWGNYSYEIKDQLPLVHVSAGDLAKADLGETRLILDVQFNLFDFSKKPKTLRDDVDAQLATLKQTIAASGKKVPVLYLMDEPDLNGVPKATLEAANAKVKAAFPEAITYVTYGLHCFDPAFTSTFCDQGGLQPADRRLASGIDWVSFDWYTDGSCGAKEPFAHFNCAVADGVQKLKALGLGSTKIVITGESMDLYQKSEFDLRVSTLLAADLASRDDAIVGVDYFLWANVTDTPSFKGITAFPELKKTIQAMGKDVICKRGKVACEKITLGATAFRTVSGGVMNGYYSDGNSYCAFKDLNAWNATVGLSILDPSLPLLHRVPDMPTGGKCL